MRSKRFLEELFFFQNIHRTGLEGLVLLFHQINGTLYISKLFVKEELLWLMMVYLQLQ